MEGIKEHVETDHMEFVLLRNVSENQLEVSRNFEVFKGELTNILKAIIEDHNAIKQELFILRQDNHKSIEKMDNIYGNVKYLTNLMSSENKSTASHQTSTNTSSAATSQTSTTENAKSPTKSSSSASPVTPNKTSPGMTTTASKPSKAKPKPKSLKACIIGDSISGSLDLTVIAKTMCAEVSAARAYSSIDVASENEAKEKTRFPEKSFAKVIDLELVKSKPDILIVQSGSVDISNLKTKSENALKYGEYFKQQAIISASSLFTTVCNALNSNPNLEKVILMKQVPRYDPISTDPHSIKAAISQLYNDTLMKLWLGSPLKHRLTIGSHSLECSGGVRDSRYRYMERFDGIHLLGPSGRKAYTESVLRIIRSGGHIQSPPPSYFRRYHSSEKLTKPPAQSGEFACPTQDTDFLNDMDVRYKKQNNNFSFQYSLPTANRFNLFNQGNC